MMIKGEEHKTKTLHDLVLLIVRLRYEHGLNDRIREQIIKAGQRHGLTLRDRTRLALSWAAKRAEADAEILCLDKR